MYDELVNRLKNNRHPNGLKSQAADAIEELQKDLKRSKDFEAFWQYEAEEALKKLQVAIASKPRWIPVTERLPPVGEKVLVITIGKGKQYVETDTLLATGEWFDYGNVTHWMPLPEPPDHIGDANEMVEKEDEP